MAGRQYPVTAFSFDLSAGTSSAPPPSFQAFQLSFLSPLTYDPLPVSYHLTSKALLDHPAHLMYHPASLSPALELFYNRLPPHLDPN
jgi:hypothetical protein